jgi:hypothetical protein
MKENSMKIEKKDGQLNVPDQVEIPFIEGDGTGPDIWRAARLVFDKAVDKTYGAGRSIAGRRCWQVKRGSTGPANGFLRKPSTPFGRMGWLSRGLSQHPWAKVFAA